MGYVIAVVFVVLYILCRRNAKKEKEVFEDQNNSLANEKEALRVELEDLKEKQEKACTLQSLSAEIAQKQEDISKLKNKLVGLGDLSNINAQKEELRESIRELQQEELLESIKVFVPDQFKSEEYKTQLAICKSQQAELVKSGKATTSTGNSGSKKELNDNIKQIIRCFNAECESIYVGLTVKNVDTRRSKVSKSYDVLNKIFAVDGVKLSSEYYEKKLEELNLYFAYDQQLQIEKEYQKAAREQLLEEEKVRREIEQAKKKNEKEESQFKNEIDKLMGYMRKADDIEKKLYIDKIKELEEKLKLVEKDKEDILNREQNTRAGYVYVISNIGSFGEDVYKIGMTRRLEPMDRIKELGDASVPFPFDVHALIFSEDAPALESILHQTFRKYEVNKVNQRKEFFKLPIDEIEEVVKNNHNATVHFVKIPDAEQYRASVEMTTA